MPNIDEEQWKAHKDKCFQCQEAWSKLEEVKENAKEFARQLNALCIVGRSFVAQAWKREDIN